jgi:hypothetical protein
VQLLGVTTRLKNVTEFFRSVIDDTISTREKGCNVRPDIIQHLIQAKKGDTRDETSKENGKDIDNTHSTYICWAETYEPPVSTNSLHMEPFYVLW